MNVQIAVLWVLSLGALAFQVYAFADAARQRSDAYPASGNQTKPIWLLITGASVAIGLISLPNFFGPLSIFLLLAIVAPAVYLTRVRPAIRSITGRGGSTSGGW